MRNWKVVAGLIACVAVSAAVYAQQKGGKALTALDYAEIQQLYIRYNWGIDTHAENGMAWAKTFVPDGEFNIVGAVKHVGREKLAEFAKLKPGAPPANAPHHYATNIRIESSPGGARGGAYFFNVPTPEPNKPAAITGTGTYEDILVKTSEGWRFKQRNFYSNALPPSMVSPASSN